MTYESIEDFGAKILGETPVFIGESFNLHYRTSQAFLKVTRAHGSAAGLKRELATVAQLPPTLAIAPLFSQPFVFGAQSATVWPWLELTPVRPEEARAWGEQQIHELHRLTLPTDELNIPAYARHIVLQASHRADGLSKRVEEETQRLMHNKLGQSLPSQGFLHGDMHEGNIVKTAGKLQLIDWESSLQGPREWDLAQIALHSTPVEAHDYINGWKQFSLDHIFYYRRLRALGALDHFLETKQRPKFYHRVLDFLGWATP